MSSVVCPSIYHEDLKLVAFRRVQLLRVIGAGPEPSLIIILGKGASIYII
jgi:hypothetical protein